MFFAHLRFRDHAHFRVKSEYKNTYVEQKTDTNTDSVYEPKMDREHGSRCRISVLLKLGSRMHGLTVERGSYDKRLRSIL